jgi:hypothetical protein
VDLADSGLLWQIFIKGRDAKTKGGSRSCELHWLTVQGGAVTLKVSHMSRGRGRRNSLMISAPLPLMGIFWMSPLLARSISLDSTFKGFRSRCKGTLGFLMVNFFLREWVKKELHSAYTRSNAEWIFPLTASTALYARWWLLPVNRDDESVYNDEKITKFSSYTV